jgi:cytochrome bd-type quinol oxidase subunit 2
MSFYDILSAVFTPTNSGLSVSAMRWKLFVFASVVSAVGGFALWCVIALLLFGTARELARHDWILFLTMLIPIIVAILAGVFVYRHTARRRKTQALLVAILSLILSAAGYVVASSLFPERLLVPRTYELRHAR